MSVGYVWTCDGCGLEGRDGYPGAPPDGWVRLNASISGHVRSRDRDFCPECALSVDAVAVAQTGDLLSKPSSPTPKARKAKALEIQVPLDGEVDPDALAEQILEDLDPLE